MTTVRKIIVNAYLETGIVQDADDLDADKLEQGLERLQSLYDSLFGHELGEPLLPVNYGKANLVNAFAIGQDAISEIDSTYVPSNVRLILNLEDDATVYLNPSPRDGERVGMIDNAGNLSTNTFTIDANGRKIEDASSVTLSTDSVNREWFYRGDLGKWTRVTDLVVDDESPLPRAFDDLLATMLAIRINPRHGAKTSDEMIETLKRIRRLFRARYAQTREQNSEMGLWKLTSNRCYWIGSPFFNG